MLGHGSPMQQWSADERKLWKEGGVRAFFFFFFGNI